MERFVYSSAEEAEAIRQSRLDAGAVEISQSGLTTALCHIMQEKKRALDDQEWAAATSWRRHEREVANALAGFGLARPLCEGSVTL